MARRAFAEVSGRKESRNEAPGKILAPENRERLAAKLAEYEARMQPFTAPEMQLDTVYKIAVIKPLVELGEVNYDGVYKELAGRFNTVDNFVFQNAWKVIEDYANTGGQNVMNSSGF